MATSSSSDSDQRHSLRDFLPVLRSRLGLYVPMGTYLATCSFISGYRWGAQDTSLQGFQEWMLSRGKGRPEQGWPWLVLAEIYPNSDTPDVRSFNEAQDSAALEVLFEMLTEYYAAVEPETDR